MMNRTSALKFILICSFVSFYNTQATAQIIPDNTLGAESSRVITNGNIDKIDGGALRDRNLFHSFQEFNINNGQSVYFSNPSGVENILTRVTGKNGSNILGTLGVDGAANLFLINPNGILFGENARLDVQGSFVGSTADSIKLQDGKFFSAVNNQETPLLTISVPIGLQMGKNPGKITIKGKGHNLTYETEQFTFATIRGDVGGLQTQPGKTLAFVGGDIALEGGNLKANSGRIELGSLAQAGLVSFNQNNSGLTLGYAGIENFGDIQLSQKASVDASGTGVGSIQLQSRRLSLKDGSAILSIVSGAKPGGDFTVNATDSVELIGESADGNYASSLLVESQGAGDSGNLTVNTTKLTVTDGAYLSNRVTSSGNSGNVTVNATDSIDLLDGGIFESGLYSETSLGSSGNPGKLEIKTGNLTLRNRAVIYGSSNGSGDSADISIKASDAISAFDGRIVSALRKGNGGDIKITAGNLSLNNGSRLYTEVREEGNAGNIFVEASDSMKLNGVNENRISSIQSILRREAVGRTGDIQINTGLLSATDGGQIFTTSNGLADTGNITINARDLVSFSGFDPNSRFLSKVSTNVNGAGNSGDIKITAGELSLTNSGLISTQNFGNGNSGGIFLDVGETITFDGGGSEISPTPSSARSSVSNIGIAGDIEVKAGSLFLRNGGQIVARTNARESINNSVNAGNITINARDIIEFDGANSGLFNEKLAGTGRGADINITASESITLRGSQISASTGLFASGDAGNINITTDSFNLVDGANVGAVTFNQGNGGNITFNTDVVEITNGSRVSTTTFRLGGGNAGNINLNVKDRITLTGKKQGSSSGLFAETAGGNTGEGSNISIQKPRLVVIANGAEVSVSSRDRRNAGDIALQADTVSLNNGSINAKSIGTQGGDINLQLGELLLLRNNSQISTTAGNQQFGGDGGNITTNSPFLIAVPNENSDITANAFTGRGGNVDIVTQGIFGINPAAELTSQSDITASSSAGIQGQISVTDPEINPTQGVIELPSGLVDKSDQVAQICPRGANAERLGEFIITGKGSVPPSPLSLLEGTVELSRLATLDEDRGGRRGRGGRGGRRKQERESQEIVEAQGFVKNADGEIYLAARVPKATPSFSNIKTACVEGSQK